MEKLQLSWLWKMALRDSRRNRSRLLLFTSSIVLGVAALVAISSFGNNLRTDIDAQAKELLGADLSITSNVPPVDSVSDFLQSIGGTMARENAFSSMVYFPKSEGTRPVQVRALEGEYPFYGKFETIPANAVESFAEGPHALVDQTLLLQFNAKVGDSIKIGELYFEIAGKLLQVPGQNNVMSAVYAPIYIPMRYLNETDLIKKGSRVSYKFYYKFDETVVVDEMMEGFEDEMKELRLRYDTVSERKENMGEAFGNLTRFLNLVAFIALLLGCLGVASAVHIYIRDKISTVAILRCLGASGRQTFLIYLFQIAAMGLLGSILGAVLGSIIQMVLPIVMAEFLPITATASISWVAIGQGILTGIVMAVLFALLPLLSIRKVSPLYTLRASFETEKTGIDWVRIGVGFVIALFIFTFAFIQTRGLSESFFFVLAVGVGFLVLAGVSQLLTWSVRRFFPKNWNYIWRQSLANLYRPNNQTLVLMIAIGLGTALISTLYFVQGTLINEIALTDQGDRPNMVIYDILPNESEAIQQLATDYSFPVVQDVPVVSMRLEGLKGKSRLELLKDTASDVRTGTLNREYRVTFRDSVIDSEEIVEGEWVEEITNPDDSIFISLEEGFGKRSMKVELGDEIIFDVSGVPLKTYVGSFRKVDFQRVQTNFLVVFPKGVLENAPQFKVLITKTSSNSASANFQRDIAQKHPNVSVIDLALILKTVEEILQKVAFVIRFMAMFSILTGLIVLIGSVINSKFQRIQESVLLRTLGANRSQILWINALEYIFLGSFAALTGIVLSLIGSWAVLKFQYELSYAPEWDAILYVFVGITSLTLIIGLLNIRGILNKAPLEVLRKEA